MKTIIHVGQQTIAQNRRDGTNHPPLIVRNYKGAKRAHTVEVFDAQGNVAGRFMYRPHNPLPCGARLWFESENEVRIIFDPDIPQLSLEDQSYPSENQ